LNQFNRKPKELVEREMMVLVMSILPLTESVDAAA
jgi:hypothetical protein